MSSPEYSPRKQYVPMLVGVNAPEVALDVLLAPAVKLTGLPVRAVPPVVHGLTPCAQTKKLTDPVGEPPAALPLTTAESVIDAPSTIEVCCGVVTVGAGALLTVKHSPVLASEDPRYGDPLAGV